MEICLEDNPVEDWEDIRVWCGTDLSRDCFKSRLRILCLGADVIAFGNRGMLSSIPIIFSLRKPFLGKSNGRSRFRC